VIGGSRSLKIIDVDKSKKRITSVCYDNSKSVCICKRFHTIQANSGKIITFCGVPLFDALIQGKPLAQGHKILPLKTRFLGAAHSEDFVILACTVLIGLKGVTDR